MIVRGFITHKAAENYSDCADYFRICPPTKRVAISDGVSQSIMPAEWARILVDSFVDKEWAPGESTDEIKKRWLDQAEKFANEQRTKGENPWMLENCLKTRDGAAATFCGVIFLDESNWTASILGDSSLIEIDKDNHIVRICSSKDGVFDNRPDFFDSFGEANGEIRKFDGTLNNGSKILLVSDPFSELLQKVKGTPEEAVVVTNLLSTTDISDFNTEVDALRKEHQMHNDDSTLVIIEPDGSDLMTIRYEETLDSSMQEENCRIDEERECKKGQDENPLGRAITEGNEEEHINNLSESSANCRNTDGKDDAPEIQFSEGPSCNEDGGETKEVELDNKGSGLLLLPSGMGSSADIDEGEFQKFLEEEALPLFKERYYDQFKKAFRPWSRADRSEPLLIKFLHELKRIYKKNG